MLEKTIMNKSAIELRKPSGTVAIKANFTATQRKIYDGFLYIAQEFLKIDPKIEQFQVNLPELTKLLKINISGQKNHNDLKKQIYDLMKVIIEYNILGKDKIIEGKATALNNIEFHLYTKKEGTKVKFSIPYRVKQAIINKNSIFAIIDLVVIKNLKSKYAIILYELIKDYKGAEIPEMSIEDFRKIFGITDKYKTMSLVKQWVLEPAIKEINKSSYVNYLVSYKINKVSNINKSIKFYIKQKQEVKPKPKKQEKAKQEKAIVQEEVQKEVKKPEPDKIEKLINKIPAQYRNSCAGLVKKALKTYPEEYIEAQIVYTNLQEGIKNYPAFLSFSLQNDAGDSEGYIASLKMQEWLKENESKILGKTININGKNYIIEKIQYKKIHRKVTIILQSEEGQEQGFKIIRSINTMNDFEKLINSKAFKIALQTRA